MSIFRSFFSKNNTIVSNLSVNTGRNPVIELNFGYSDNLSLNQGFSRLIFDIDLTDLRSKLSSGEISTGCTTGLTHTLKMTNASFFDETLVNGFMPNGRRRATSFDLIVFRIPSASGTPQSWDEGVGYDYSNFNTNNNTIYGTSTPLTYVDDRSYSDRPSNWVKRTTISNWNEPGIYNNLNSGSTNYSGLTIVGQQHFSIGNENLEIDMTSEINGILFGDITGVTGWGICYLPQIENLSGLSETYGVSFFSRHTQTFYQPYLETNYNDLITDDRNNFLKNQTNNLYLYVIQNGDYVNLDNNPIVRIEDTSGNLVPGLGSLSACSISKGIYGINIPNVFSGYSSPCMFYDIWSGLTINGQPISNVENQFILKNYNAGISIGPYSKEPEKFSFSFYGINQNEKILPDDIRKVGVIIKKLMSTQTQIYDIVSYYRIYVKEGNVEVEVQDWTEINRTPNEHYFLVDMRDKLPNQYFIDLILNIAGEKTTYKRQLSFEIVAIK